MREGKQQRDRECHSLVEEALRYLPNDKNVRGNLANAKGQLSIWSQDYVAAASYFREALRYYPNDKVVLDNLNRAKQLVSSAPRRRQEDAALAKAKTAEAKLAATRDSTARSRLAWELANERTEEGKVKSKLFVTAIQVEEAGQMFIDREPTRK